MRTGRLFWLLVLMGALALISSISFVVFRHGGGENRHLQNAPKVASGEIKPSVQPGAGSRPKETVAEPAKEAAVGLLPETRKTIREVKGSVSRNEGNRSGVLVIVTAAMVPIRLAQLEDAIRMERDRRTAPDSIARLDQAAAAIARTRAKYAADVEAIADLEVEGGARLTGAQDVALEAHWTCIKNVVAALEALH